MSKKKQEPEEDSEDFNDDESSSDEDEDEFGDLITEDIEAGINKVLKVIDENPEVLLDKNTKFFGDIKAPFNNERNEKHKPIYLKDYHRLRLLATEKDGFDDDDDEEENEDTEKPYAIQQKEDKANIIAEINKATNSGDEDYSDDDDEDFFKKRKEQRTVEAIELPNPEKDSSKFLEEYLNQKAWLPRTVDKKTGELIVPSYNDLVEDDEEFDENAEQFEQAYNFRFEDPNSAEVMSYARSQNTIRREKESSRKRKRDAKKATQEVEEEKQEAELSRLKKKKATQIMDKLGKLKQQLTEDPDAEELAKIFTDDYLDGDFEGDEWDKRMRKVFDEEFYSKKPEKINGDEELADEEEGENEEEQYDEEDEEIPNDGYYEEEEEETSGKSRNQLKKEEKLKKKQEKKQLQEAAQRVVEENVNLLIKEEGSNTLKKKLEQPKFRYREVSPDSFGLTARDILLAEDQDLNQYVGLKKLAVYRDEEKKEKDRRRLGKKKRLKEWRMNVFNTKEEPDDALVERIFSGKKRQDDSEQRPKKKSKKNKN